MKFALPLLLLTLCAINTDNALAAETSASHASRIIQYRGKMPLLPKEHWGKEIELRFELYRSPDGGVPFWTEARKVSVAKDGWVKVDLGEVSSLPDEAFTTPFRFLSIWHGKVEFIPRKQIASLAYVASIYEQKLPPNDRGLYSTNAMMSARAAAEQATGRETKLDGEMIDCGGFSMEKHPRLPANWFEATEIAGRIGARLPTFEEWYGAYDGKASTQFVSMTGHYEWVIPWVYEPSIHSRFHELYRGKPVACYYEELSPKNEYPFRLVRP